MATIVKTTTVDGVARVRVTSFGAGTSAALSSAFEALAQEQVRRRGD